MRDVHRAAYDFDNLTELGKPEVWQATKRALKEQYPLEQGGTQTIQVPSAAQWVYGGAEYENTAVARMRQAGQALEDKGVLRSERDKDLMELISVNEYMYQKLFPKIDFNKRYDRFAQEERAIWKQTITDYAAKYADERQMMNAMKAMTLLIGAAWPSEIEEAA